MSSVNQAKESISLRESYRRYKEQTACYGGETSVYKPAKSDTPSPPSVTMSPKEAAYAIYVLLILATTYLLNQLDRYMISICSKSMAQDIHYGDLGCMPNRTAMKDTLYIPKAIQASRCNETSRGLCEDLGGCSWGFTGLGLDYEILVGPVFIVVYTLVGIPISFWADIYSRKILLACFLTFWSLMTALTGLATEYWHLVILRFALGIGQAGCTPLATSLLSDYFPPQWRATAIGIYNWGIYFGYSMSYSVGNYVTARNINDEGWRWAFYVSGIPGLILGPIIFLTVREPERQVRNDARDAEDLKSIVGTQGEEVTKWQKLAFVGKTFLSPSLLLLCLGGSLRNGAGYIWAYNLQPYYQSIGETGGEIAGYMSWIPLVGGSIGVVLGGFISDKVVKRVGPYARLLVLVASQVLATPFVFMALYLRVPLAYYMLLGGYIIGEMWVGICLAIVVELVPTPLRTVAVAVYLFLISNIGGNMPLLVPPIQQAFIAAGANPVGALRNTLFILYPGMYLFGAVFFLFTICALRRDLRKAREYQSLQAQE